MRPGLLLAIDAGMHTVEGGIAADEPLTSLERLDEIVVSTIRAAAAAEIPIVMSYDATFGPLAVQGVVQYVTPRLAEEIPSSRLARGADTPQHETRLSFVRIQPSTRSVTRRGRRRLWWHQLAVDAGVAAPDIESMDALIERRGIAAALVLLGGLRGRRLVDRLASEAPWVNVFSLRPFSAGDGRVTFIDDGVRVQLDQARSQREPLDVRDPDRHVSEVERVAEPPYERSSLQPYALFAQRLISSLG